ncbi:hypothetical protein ACEPAF_8777 [Sanghuangporus sanghuang]
MKNSFSDANLPQTSDGRHIALGVRAGENFDSASRAEAIAHFLDQIEHSEYHGAMGMPVPAVFRLVSNRGFLTITGRYHGVPIGIIISIGIGYPNLTWTSLLGSCGGLTDYPVGALVVPYASISIRRNYDFDFLLDVPSDDSACPYEVSEPDHSSTTSSSIPPVMFRGSLGVFDNDSSTPVEQTDARKIEVIAPIPQDAPSPTSTASSDGVHSPLTPEDGDEVNLPPKPGLDYERENVTKAGFKLGSSSIDEGRPFKVVVIGAGYSGIIAGIRFTQRMENIDLTIYEKNAGVGGTWFSNRYPGIANDVPAHCYQLTFEQKTDWSAFYSPGPEIRTETERIVEKYKLMRHIRLNHELTHAKFDEMSGKWILRLRRPRASSDTTSASASDNELETIEDTADFVLAGVGSLSRWSWPDIEGLKDFKGKILHSASWPTDESGWWHSSVADWSDKRVGVIGSGSTATQIVPTLQPRVKHLFNYVRGKTWLSPTFLGDRMSEILGHDKTSDNHVFTDEDRNKLKDPEFYKHFRHGLENEMNSMHLITIRGTDLQKQRQKEFKEYMLSRLKKKPWIANYLMPDFSVTCRRLTPGPGYLEALQADNVDFVPRDIKRITETGVELDDGTHHELDVIVCATGYDTSYNYPFSVIGRGGQTLKDRFTPHPETYISLCVDGFPNWFMSMGPNSVFGAGSMLIVMEKQVEYAIQVAKKMQREHIKSIEPKFEAVRIFDEYLEEYFKTTTFTENCRSWYKMGKAEGRVVGLWPGSTLHVVKTFQNPRWEDYNYEFLDSVPGSRGPNRFYWLGDGSTYNEKHLTGDRAWYLRDNEVDIPPVPE